MLSIIMLVVLEQFAIMWSAMALEGKFPASLPTVAFSTKSKLL
jgi:hypothetical protein